MNNISLYLKLLSTEKNFNNADSVTSKYILFSRLSGLKEQFEYNTGLNYEILNNLASKVIPLGFSVRDIEKKNNEIALLNEKIKLLEKNYSWMKNILKIILVLDILIIILGFIL